VRAVSDDDRKKKARDEDEDAEETKGSDEADEGEESAEDEGEEAEASEKADDGEEAAEKSDDEAAQRVAAALGVSGDEEPAAEEKAEGEGEEAAPVQNRAARRAEAAQRRKKRKAAAPATDAEEAEPELPKDKNARAKELLKRRREQAAAGPARPVQLLPSEMVDDALTRSASAAGKWLRKNFSVIQWVIVGAIVAGGGYAFYQSQTEKKSANASDALIAGVKADRGRVMAEDKRSDEDKADDPTKVFKTAEERADNALASYRKVESGHAGTGAAILARLGEGGALLDKRDYNGALEAFSQVASSTLAGADSDVKARALEGLGFAKEGKKDFDGAITTFKELAGMAGYKELGQYHEARMLLAKGDKDKAKDLLKQVYDVLEKPTEVKSTGYLKAAVEDTLRRIDPSLVPQKAAIGGGAKGGSMSQEEIERAIKKFKENLEKQAKEKEKHE
jgi:hypothetical protein